MGDYKNYFLSIFPEDGCEDLLRQVLLGYKKNSDFMRAQELQSGPQSNVYPHNRIAHIDNALLSLHNKYQGLAASTHVNSTGGWKYTLVSYGNIRMTASSVNTPSTTPRDSLFRNRYASSQISFSENIEKGVFELDQLMTIEEGIIYALIIHGPAVDNPKLPAFVHIAFPNHNCSEYLDRINLFDEYPHVVSSFYSKGIEIIPDMATTQLKLNIEEQSK